MSRFIQLHLLTSYPPSNLNRDDTGRPKTAKMGGVDRLRVSSQSLKRTWRKSDIFKGYIEGQGTRTRKIGLYAKEKLQKYDKLSGEDVFNISCNVAKCFGKVKANDLVLETAVFISEKEFDNIDRVLEGFSDGIDNASVAVNDLGFRLLTLLSGKDLFEQAERLSDKLADNGSIFSKAKPAEIVKEFKEYKDKVKDKNSIVDKVEAMIREMNKEFDSLSGRLKGDTKYSKEQFVCLVLQDFEKTAKNIAKKFGSLKSKKEAEGVPYGELLFKSDVKLSRDWKGLLGQWCSEIDNDEENDFGDEESISLLEQYISPSAISRDSILTNEDTNVDMAMFGRMLASSPKNNIEAACQVAHAISVHGVVIEDDYFTAVDDLNDHSEDAGAAHIGETGFAAGLFYSYICINKELLVENLNNDVELANKAIAALTEAAVKVAPEGKQNSFGSRAYASYVLAEKGSQQPRSLAVSFLKPVTKNAEDYGAAAIQALETQVENFEAVYGPCAGSAYVMNVPEKKGTLAELLTFVTE